MHKKIAYYIGCYSGIYIILFLTLVLPVAPLLYNLGGLVRNIFYEHYSDNPYIGRPVI